MMKDNTNSGFSLIELIIAMTILLVPVSYTHLTLPTN